MRSRNLRFNRKRNLKQRLVEMWELWEDQILKIWEDLKRGVTYLKISTITEGISGDWSHDSWIRLATAIFLHNWKRLLRVKEIWEGGPKTSGKRALGASPSTGRRLNSCFQAHTQLRKRTFGAGKFLIGAFWRRIGFWKKTCLIDLPKKRTSSLENRILESIL